MTQPFSLYSGSCPATKPLIEIRPHHVAIWCSFCYNARLQIYTSCWRRSTSDTTGLVFVLPFHFRNDISLTRRARFAPVLLINICLYGTAFHLPPLGRPRIPSVHSCNFWPSLPSWLSSGVTFIDYEQLWFCPECSIVVEISDRTGAGSSIETYFPQSILTMRLMSKHSHFSLIFFSAFLVYHQNSELSDVLLASPFEKSSAEGHCWYSIIFHLILI